jgi:hypothetical protein
MMTVVLPSGKSSVASGCRIVYTPSASCVTSRVFVATESSAPWLPVPSRRSKSGRRRVRDFTRPL